MQHHGSSKALSGRRKQIVLALSLALGLATTQGQAGSSTPAASPRSSDGPAAALMRRAAEAGIAVPADLPGFIEYRTREKAKALNATPKATITVTNCGNDGPGSLRAAVAFASSGDVVDLTGSGCNSINLTSSIVTSVENLTIRADPAGSSKYSISGGNQVRPLTHNGTGKLTLEGVSVSLGKVTGTTNGPVQGGCVFSQGSVELRDQAQVKYCEARNTRTSGSPSAEGGAIFAANAVTLADGARVAGGKAISTVGSALGGGIKASLVTLSGGLVESNTAQLTGSGASAIGGGIHADRITAKYSIVRNNKALVSASASGLSARGAGAAISGEGASAIKYSTFNNNTIDASGAGGGGGAAIIFGDSHQPGSLEIKSSTIANNATTNSTKYGGALSLSKNATIRSSTISGNTESNASDTKYGAGITLNDGVTLTMTSSVIAGNRLINATGSLINSDLGLRDADAASGSGTATVIGTHNFRDWVHNGITWPSGNFGGLTSPRLGPLQDNGGLTPTMFPNPDSPLINQGATTGLSTPFVDQRGEGFPRVHGAQADIGAVEWSWRAEIFEDGFEFD